MVAYNSCDKEADEDSSDILFAAFDAAGTQSVVFTESDVEDLARENIMQVAVGPESGLIHVMDTDGRIYIINHEIKLKNQTGGLIFTLDLGLSSNPKTFYLPSNL